jgi:hypothetical protein
MKSLWQTKSGCLVRQWCDEVQHTQYNPPWMRETKEMQSGYLPPLPDFSSHSPFGGAYWFQPHLAIPSRSLDEY